MTRRALHEVRLRPPIWDVPILPYVEAPGAAAPHDPPRPHPMAEFLYGGRPPPADPRGLAAATWGALGTVAATLAASVALALF